MKIALITGGQPRFTQDFLTLLNQLTGFDSADIYMNLWTSDWATTDQEAEEKVAKILPPKYRVGKIRITPEPPYTLPPHTTTLAEPSPENIQWWYKRGHAQAIGLVLAEELINQDYDAVIRFRLDGCLDRPVDLSKFDLTKTPLVLPGGPLSGFKDIGINDQFAIGTPAAMKFYCDLGKEYKELVPAAQPQWESTPAGWTIDYLIGYYLKKYNHPYAYSDFICLLNTRGRSRHTDKHLHHSIVPDPTAT